MTLSVKFKTAAVSAVLMLSAACSPIETKQCIRPSEGREAILLSPPDGTKVLRNIDTTIVSANPSDPVWRELRRSLFVDQAVHEGEDTTHAAVGKTRAKANNLCVKS